MTKFLIIRLSNDFYFRKEEEYFEKNEKNKIFSFEESEI